MNDRIGGGGVHRVQLAVYDLSNGMARGLSAQFLGPSFEIPAIPHTGLVVYDPAVFRQTKGLHPFQTIELGMTTITKAQFDRWCRATLIGGAGARFGPYSYDLLTRNCNHFCHEALVVLGIDPALFPSWILEVPQRFLSSPLGQMVRPMLENMQITSAAAAPVVGTSGLAPTPTRSGPAAALAATTVGNPWAAPSANAAPSCLSVSSASDNPWRTKEAPAGQTKNDDAVVASTATAAATTTTTTASSMTDRPLLSNDTQTVRLCVTKITKALLDDDFSGGQVQRVLERFATDVEKGHHAVAVASSSDWRDVCDVMGQVLERNVQTTYALMLARIVVLHGPSCCDGPSSSSSSSSPSILEWIHDHVAGLSGNAKALAWLVVANIIGTSCNGAPVPGNEQGVEAVAAAMDEWVWESAVADMADESVAVRQAVAAVLYNASLLMSSISLLAEKVKSDDDDDVDDNKELDDSAVSILCILLEEETDATTRERRLMAALVWLRASAAARILAKELGLTDYLAAGNDERPQLADKIVSLLMP